MRSGAGFFTVAGCRIYQGVLKAGNYFMGYRTPECIEGPRASGRIGELLEKERINDVLVVTGASISKRGLLSDMLTSFEKHSIRYTVFTLTRPDPSSDDVEAGYRVFCESGSKAIVAFGGGSRIDCAKGIAARAARPSKSIPALQGLLKVRRRTVPFVAVPTTAGAGSETTVAAVITDSATGRKAAVNDPALVPDYAVLDPSLTVGLPASITAATGMDALCHAVEAYTNGTYNTKLENSLARKAVKLIHTSLLKAYQNGEDLEARVDMQRAAFYAGRAFTRGCVGYVHATGHTLGGLYGVSHGVAMATLLPLVMKQYGKAVYSSLASLADVCGIEGRDNREKAEAFILWIENLNRQMGLPESFDMIRDEDIDVIIRWATREANPLYPVPVIWGDSDFRTLIRSVRGEKEQR